MATLTSIQFSKKKSPKQPVQDVWTSCETPSQSLMLLWRYSQLFPSWLAFGNGGIWQVESHLCVKQMYYYLTRKCKKNYYYFTRKCKTLPPTIWKWDHHKLCGRPFPGIFLEMPVSKHLKGHSAPRVCHVTFLLKDHWGPSVSYVTFLLKGRSGPVSVTSRFSERSLGAQRQSRHVFTERSFGAQRQSRHVFAERSFGAQRQSRHVFAERSFGAQRQSRHVFVER